MLTGIFAAISNLFSAAGSYFGWQNTVQQEKNTKEMVANKEAQQKQQTTDRVNQEIEDSHGTDPKKAKAAQDKLRVEWSED